MLVLALLPHLGRAAAFDHENDLLIKMAFEIERAGAGHLDHIEAPKPLGSKKLDERAAAAEPSPRHQRQILHLTHADAAIAGHPLGLHEPVVGQRLALEFAEPRVFSSLRLVPVDLIGRVVHGAPLDFKFHAI